MFFEISDAYFLIVKFTNVMKIEKLINYDSVDRLLKMLCVL